MKAIADLPEDLRQHVEQRGYKDLETVLANDLHLHRFTGADKSHVLRVPRGDRASDPEGWKAVDAVLGVPESPDGYQHDAPKDAPPVDGAYTKAFFEKMHAAGAPQALVAAALDAFHELNAQAVKAGTDKYKEEVEAGLQTLKQEWGPDYERRVALSQTVVDALPEGMRAEAQAFLDDTGAGNDPRGIRMMAAVAELLGEDGAPAGRGGGTFGKLTKEQAEAELPALEKKLGGMAANDVEYGATLKRRNDLLAIIHPAPQS